MSMLDGVFGILRTIASAGSAVPSRATLDFTDGLQAIDDADNGKTLVSLRADTRTALVNALTAGAYDGEKRHCDGYYARGDGGGGMFVWDEDNVDAAVPGMVIGTGTGRWIRIFAGPVNVRWFGAKGDGTTDDTSAIQAAIEFALASANRVVQLSGSHKITDIDITNRYFCGLIIESSNLTHQPNTASLLVSGATSQGLDLSGTEGVTLRDISIRGDASAAPRCAIFAQRTTANPQSPSHLFENVRVLGSFSKAGVYNYAGEIWSFTNCFLWCDAGGRSGYFTSTNSLGLVSKFADLDTTVTPMTATSIVRCDIRCSSGHEALWFEQQTATAGDRTVQSINIEECYLVVGGSADCAVLLTECTGGLVFARNVDESYATESATSCDKMLKITGSRQFQRLTIRDNTLYCKTYPVYATAPVVWYDAANNWVQSIAKTWRFTSLFYARHSMLSEIEAFTVVTAGSNIQVVPSTATAAANVSLPALCNQYRATDYAGAPTANLNPETRGQLVFDTRFNQLYVSNGIPSGADSYSWRQLGDREVSATIPTSGNYELGKIVWKATPTTGGYIAWVCTDTGTMGTLAGVTGSISNGSPTLTVNSATNLAVGQRLSIAGVTGPKLITAIVGTTITLNGNADATVSGAAITFYAATFKEWGAIA